jgi:hypothetical protein
MTAEPRSRRRRRKKIVRKSDGSLYDLSERRRISHSELKDYVRDGGLFEARRQDTGADCTYEVLQGMVGTGVMENLVPGLGGGPLSGLGGLGPMGALTGGSGGLGQLGALARLVGQEGRGFDDWDEPPRRSRRRGSERDWSGWDEAPPESGRRESDRDWGDWEEAEHD